MRPNQEAAVSQLWNWNVRFHLIFLVLWVSWSLRYLLHRNDPQWSGKEKPSLELLVLYRYRRLLFGFAFLDYWLFELCSFVQRLDVNALSSLFIELCSLQGDDLTLDGYSLTNSWKAFPVIYLHALVPLTVKLVHDWINHGDSAAFLFDSGNFCEMF